MGGALLEVTLAVSFIHRRRTRWSFRRGREHHGRGAPALPVVLDSAWFQASLNAQTRRRRYLAQRRNVRFAFDFLRFEFFRKWPVWGLVCSLRD
jgi:hypothetical protein